MVHRIRETENLKNWGQISAKLPHPAGMGMAEGNTIEDFLFIDTQILRCPIRGALRHAQNDSTVFFRRMAGHSTIVESSLQIGVFFAKRTQSGVVSDYAGQVFSYCVKGYKLFEIRRL